MVGARARAQRIDSSDGGRRSAAALGDERRRAATRADTATDVVVPAASWIVVEIGRPGICRGLPAECTARGTILAGRREPAARESERAGRRVLHGRALFFRTRPGGVQRPG